MGSTSPKTRFLGHFYDFQRPRRRKRARNEAFSLQQGVPGYGPQAAAMQSLSLATIVYSMARGPSPEP